VPPFSSPPQGIRDNRCPCARALRTPLASSTACLKLRVSQQSHQRRAGARNGPIPLLPQSVARQPHKTAARCESESLPPTGPAANATRQGTAVARADSALWPSAARGAPSRSGGAQDSSQAGPCQQILASESLAGHETLIQTNLVCTRAHRAARRPPRRYPHQQSRVVIRTQRLQLHPPHLRPAPARPPRHGEPASDASSFSLCDLSTVCH